MSGRNRVKGMMKLSGDEVKAAPPVVVRTTQAALKKIIILLTLHQRVIGDCCILQALHWKYWWYFCKNHFVCSRYWTTLIIFQSWAVYPKICFPNFLVSTSECFRDDLFIYLTKQNTKYQLKWSWGLLHLAPSFTRHTANETRGKKVA